jgi:hypothetical protein
MRKITALFVALFVYFGALFAPAMGASLLSKPGRSASSTTDVAGKKSLKKKCKKLKKKIKKAKTKKAKKRAKKRYNKKCKCKKLKKKAKRAKSAKKRKRAQKKYNKKCTSGSGSGGGGGGSGGGGGGNPPPPGKTERKAEGTYASPVVGIAGIGYACGMGCVEFPTTPEEAYVSVEIVDDSGQPAGAALAQDVDGDGVGDIFATVCGKTDAPIAITPGLPLTVAVGAGVVVDVAVPPGACPSVATSGKVLATFSNQP